MRVAILAAIVIPTAALAAERTVRFSSPMYFLPPVKEIAVTRDGGSGPGAAKYKPLALAASLKDSAKLPGAGPFDIWLVPKDGKPIKAVAGFKPKDGVNEIKLNDHLGVIHFRGAGQPRGTLLVTPVGDDGPESKRHTVVQTAGDTRAEMVVPPGDYAIWVAPESGARARRVVDKIRVLPGKTATAD